ncbi:efflux RND transporter periplasmic adaptor subunit [Piscinibacter terrae]|uniref:HlyD family efflux transporter periplasmic adaptor subunit n=1 Tax=Piscinibacter terrae TaxID=2496871 RepID=A0A3N7IWN1_9BURK|nr:HlyD family efflux transporter periplasmic adaptor subunit [Albitalea terrae]RQP23192.1 HlyD family efflux transporter periplasmic adaptor subunit [Albitalea terrae]
MNNPEAPSPLLGLLQLQRRAREAATPEALGFVMVNETLQLARYRQAVWWSTAGLGRVAAVSGLPQPDPNAPYVQWMASLCRHLTGAQPEAGEVDGAALPDGVRADWAEWLPAHALWLPLRRDAHAPDGALLLARDEAWAPHDLALLRELSHAYGHALHALQPQRTWRERLLGALRAGKTRRRLLIVALLACVCPVRLSVLAQAEVVPQDPFIVRSPLDGVIDRFDVRPNQPVKPGTPLFSLDTTALRARMELARKAVDTAQEEYRQSAQSAVTSDKSRAEIALRRGKLQEKAVEMDYTAEQLDRVQVKADRAGIAVFADSGDWVGKAVTLGERVLQVADPMKVELVAWLPAADLLPVAPGDTLTLYPQGSPLQSFDATVLSVAYRAEVTRDGFVAYRVKASFTAGQPVPRIGQQGTARLHGAWAPLAYVALRRPLAVMRQWLGW